MRKYKLQFNKNKTADSNGIIISEDIQFLSLKSNQRNYFHSIRCLIFIIAAFCSVFMAISFFPNIETDKTVIGFVTVTISLAFYCFTSRKRIIRYLSAVYIAFTCLYFLYYMSSITNGFYLVLKAYMINAKLPNNININYINPRNLFSLRNLLLCCLFNNNCFFTFHCINNSNRFSNVVPHYIPIV